MAKLFRHGIGFTFLKEISLPIGNFLLSMMSF